MTFHPGSAGHLVGTADRMIYFTRGDPFPSLPWAGIGVQSPNVRFEYVEIHRGGSTSASEKASIVAFEPTIVRNSAIYSSVGWGLLKRASDTTDYLSTNIFASNALGDVGTLP